MSGWIKLHRCLIDKAIWKCSTPEQKTILITLLMMANHKENEWEWNGEKYMVQPGQFITSLNSIAEKSGPGISIQNVRTALSKFEKYEFLTSKSTNKNRLITIVNWSSYQSKDDELTSNLTSNQQAVNKQLTTNKNDKNDKEDIYILSDEENRFLEILELVDNYPLDRKKDLEMYKSLGDKYPSLDLLEAIEQWKMYKLDQPLKAKSNPRSQINTSFKNYVKWGKCLKEENNSKHEEPSNWRGSDRRL